MQQLLKLCDITVFAVVFWLAVKYYSLNPYIFDVIGVVAMSYVMVRNPDVNTVTLILFILLARGIDALVFSGFDTSNPYLFYTGLTLANVCMIAVVIARPILVAKYGPKFIRHNKHLTLTHQDAMVAWLYFAHAAIPFITLIEHIIRHLNVLPFKPLFFYTLYQPAQLMLAILGFLVLFFMTFEKSKERRGQKSKQKLDA